MYPVGAGCNPLVRGGFVSAGSVVGEVGAVVRSDLGRSEADGVEQTLGADVVHERDDLRRGEPLPLGRVDVAVDVVADQGAAKYERYLATGHVLVDPGEDHGPYQQARPLPDGA